ALDPCNAGFKKELGPRVPRSGLPLKPEAPTQRTPRALRFRENAKPLHDCRGSEWPRALPQPPTPAGKLRDVLVPGSELGRHLAAVDQYRGAGYIGSEVRGEERDGRGHFVRLSAAAERDLLEVVPQDARIVEVPLREPRPDQSGADGVHAN